MPTDITIRDRDDHAVCADFAEAHGDHAEADRLRTEIDIGAKIVSGPGEHGYNPMMAKMMAKMSMIHCPRRRRAIHPDER